MIACYNVRLLRRCVTSPCVIHIDPAPSSGYVVRLSGASGGVISSVSLLECVITEKRAGD